MALTLQNAVLDNRVDPQRWPVDTNTMPLVCLGLALTRTAKHLPLSLELIPVREENRGRAWLTQWDLQLRRLHRALDLQDDDDAMPPGVDDADPSLAFLRGTMRSLRRGLDLEDPDFLAMGRQYERNYAVTLR